MATASKSYTKSSGAISALMWPANLTDAFDYLQLNIVEYVPISQSTAVINTSTSSNPTTASSSGAFAGITNISNIQSKGINQKSLKTVLLPVPENLNYSDALKWSAEDVGVASKMAAAAGKSLMGGDAAGVTDAIQAAAKGGKVGIVLEALRNAQLNPNAVTQGIGGKVVNPYTEQIFSGINMRSFDLAWKLVPRSQSEQLKIHELIREIRIHALPNYAGSLSGGGDESGGDQLSDRWLTVPHIFLLSWRTKGGNELQSLPKIKPCVLKNVQVSYTPDNVWATHMVNRIEPYPVAYNVTLSFEETEIITGKDVKDGGF